MAFASAPRSDAGVSFRIGFGYPGYYGYYPYGYYYPYRYSTIGHIGIMVTIGHTIGPAATATTVITDINHYYRR